MIAPLLASRAVVAVLSPASSLDTLLVGSDGTTAIAIAGLAPSTPDAIDSVRTVTRGALPGLRLKYPTLTLRWTGEAALIDDLRSVGQREARRVELRALPVTIVVAVIAFGSLVDAALAVLAAVLAVVVSLGVMGALGSIVPPSALTGTLVSLIGLALTVDYMLFIVRRSQDGARAGHLRRTIVLAAGVVAIGFCGLALAPTGELRAAAIAGAVTCVAAALAAITFAPRPDTAGPRPLGVRWLRWGMLVTERPWTAMAVAAAPLLFLANAARSARLATPLDQLLFPGMESADAANELRGVGRVATVGMSRVVLVLPATTPVFSEPGWRAVAAATAALGRLTGAADARSITTVGTHDREVSRDVLPALVKNAYVSRSDSIAVIDVFPRIAASTGTATQLAETIRTLDAARVTGVPGARFLVSGLPAYVLDYGAALRRALPWIVVATSLATFVALLVALRAPVIAVKAVVLNLLVAAAAIGATTLAFGTIFPTVPALAFGAAFGMSMDYELFLIAGVREMRRGAPSESEAIVVGLARTGGLITRAAAVMACLFLAFGTSALLPIAMVGFALAVAVLMDATLVRLALAPAILHVAGRWNWWPGR